MPVGGVRTHEPLVESTTSTSGSGRPLTASNNPTLPVALSQLQANYFVDYSIVLAGVLVATLPLLLLFIGAGRQLVSGIMQGAVKG